MSKTNSVIAKLSQAIFYRCGKISFYPSSKLLIEMAPLKNKVIQELERKFGRKIVVRNNTIEFSGGLLADTARANFISYVIE
ncbi:hypothetical protein ACFL27_16450 [candidate division CSSED10-310 bacterium]|uniref:Uncharacterized protein n=1 Tax=candidate division CSSED10-310 bacterium TaxID=2855610 RepID=A0ABV6Z026_UNCC1